MNRFVISLAAGWAAIGALALVAPIGSAHASTNFDPNFIAKMIGGAQPPKQQQSPAPQSARVNTHSADLGHEDLPKIRSEHRANEARWVSEYKGKSFEAVLTLQTVLGDREFNVYFKENPSDWGYSGIVCTNVPNSLFLISKNYGDKIQVHGDIAGYFMGDIELAHCQLTEPTTA